VNPKLVPLEGEAYISAEKERKSVLLLLRQLVVD
jgi:hypothetical protein